VSLPLTDLTDGELAALSIAGRDAAFAEIMRRHREAVYRVALGNTADPDEALDLTQETFVSAHLALRRYDGDRPMRAWLASIALNKCRDWARRRAVRRLFRFATPIDDVADLIADEHPGPETAAADRQSMRRLALAVADLPASLREPLVLHTVEGMSQAETAAILSITQKAVETRLRRARIKLTEMLRDI
jgi:RNA polymerase sigma factor CnrH